MAYCVDLTVNHCPENLYAGKEKQRLDVKEKKKQGKDVIGHVEADMCSPDRGLRTFKRLQFKSGILGAEGNKFCQPNGSSDKESAEKGCKPDYYVAVHDTTVSPPAFA